jgi:UDP-N-acetylmuramyl pentapeptide synthase
VRLADLVAVAEGVRIRAVGPDRDPDLVAVVHDTRAVVGGALFCCIRGTHVDGHDLAPAAVA